MSQFEWVGEQCLWTHLWFALCASWEVTSWIVFEVSWTLLFRMRLLRGMFSAEEGMVAAPNAAAASRRDLDTEGIGGSRCSRGEPGRGESLRKVGGTV